MATQKLAAAGSAASAAGNFASGNYVAAAVNAVQAIAGLFGGGEGYAQSTGYEIRGNVAGGQFQGAVTGLSSNGIHNYRISEAEGAYGERNALNLQVAELWAKYFPDNPADVSFPLDFTGAYDWGGVIRPAVESVFGAVADARRSQQDQQTLLDIFKVPAVTASIAAPDIAAITGPTAASGATIITGATTAATGDTNSGATLAAAVSSNPMLIAAALIALLFIMKG